MSGGLRHDGDDDKFVVVPRPTIRDERLSFRARGLLAFILDLPDGWEIRATWLATQGREGEEAIYSSLRELRAAGYYRVERRKGPGGRWVNGTAIRKRPSAAWAADYAAEVAARAAKQRVELPTYAPADELPFPVTHSDDVDTSTDLAVPGNREAPAGEAGPRVPPTLTEDPTRRTEEGGGGGSAVVSPEQRASASRPPLAPTAELDPPAPARDDCPPAELGGQGHRAFQAELEALRARARSTDPVRRRRAQPPASATG